MEIMLDSKQQQQTSRPPLLVGERAVWLGSGSGLPQGGVVRWMGKLQGMGPGWTVGLELDRALPYGGIDGSWCGRQLFQCRTKHGLLVPANVVVKEDALLRTFGISPVILNKPPIQQVPSEPKAPLQQSEAKPGSPQKPVTKPKRTKQANAGDSRSSSQQSRRKPSPQPPQSAPLTPKLSHQAKPAPEYLKSSPQVSQPNQIPPFSPALPSTPFFLQATPPATPEPKPRKSASLKSIKSESQTLVPDSNSETKSSIEQTENLSLSNVTQQPVPTETTLVQAQQPDQTKPKLENIVQPKLLEDIKQPVQTEASQVKVKPLLKPELTSNQVKPPLKPAEEVKQIKPEPTVNQVKPPLKPAEGVKQIKPEPIVNQVKPPVKLAEEVKQPIKPEPILHQVKKVVQPETTKIQTEKAVQPVEPPLQTDKLLQSAPLPQVKSPVQPTTELVQSSPAQQVQPEVVKSSPSEAPTVEQSEAPVLPTEPSEQPVVQQDDSEQPSSSEVVIPDTASPKPKAQRRHNKAPLPPPKSGYFHTAPARPNRHLRGVKAPAPQPPVSSEPEKVEKAAKPSSLPLHNSKENQEHAWSPLVADGRSTPPRVPLRRHNSLNGPRCTESVILEEPPSPDELIYQWFDASENPPTAPPRHTRAKPPMNNNNKSPSLSPSSSSSSFEDAIAAADAIYSERYKKHFSAVDSASSISSTSSSNRKSGGFLSFLRWLRKGGSDSSEEKVNELSHAGSTNSIGTVVSAASSFAYVCPTAYHVPENRASLHYAPSSTESETYKHRLKQRDHARHLDKNLTLKRKYKLKQFACSRETVFSETLKPTPKPSTGSGGRSRKRPAPPIPTSKSEHYSDRSLPASLEQRDRRMDMEDMDKPGAVKLHRRTASESAKDKRAGAYCHVRGKRRAPQPPANNRPNSVLSTRFKNPFPSFGRKKRPAPPPPNDLSDETSTKLSNAEKQRLISNLNKLKLHAGKNDKQVVNSDRIMQGPALITAPPIVLSCITNAPLLQAGDTPQDKPEQVVNPAPLSPKPWYKRNSTKAGKVEKRPKKDEEEMPEVNYARVLPPAVDDGRRKSTMLASISELDREAAEIVQNHRKRAEEMIAARNNSFYLPPPPPQTPPPLRATTPPTVTNRETPSPPPTPESPTPKAHTKGLISMFNAITNVSKVTVNSSTAAIAGFFSGETRRNRISQTFTVVEEQEEEESSTTVDVKVTQVQSSTSQNTNLAAVVEVDVAKEDIKTVSVSKGVKQKDTASDNKTKISSQNESPKEPQNKVNFSQIESNNVVTRNKNIGSLYPRLSTIEAAKEPVKEPPPLPLSIAGIPDSVSPTRQRRIVWSCPRCTLENPRWRLTCDVCDMWRPSSIHEETIIPLVANLHAEPDKPNTKDDTEDEFKPPEPIGAIDWESELKRYFGPNDKQEEKKTEPPAKVIISTKVEEAIKILEGKTQVVENPKPGPSKLKLDIPKPMVNGNKEPEYAAVALNKKTHVNAAVKSPESKNIVTGPKSPESKNIVTVAPKSPEPKNIVGKVTKPVEKPAEKKSAVTVKTPELSAKLKPEEKMEKNVGGKNVVQKAPVKIAEAIKAPANFIGGRTKSDEQKAMKGPETKLEAKPSTSEDSKATEVIIPQLLTKEDVDEVRKARLAFFNKPQDSVETVTDALPPASPRLPRARQSVGVPDVPSSPRLVRARTAETSTDTQELLQKLTMAAIATPAITAADREERMKLREKLKEMKNSLPKHVKEGEKDAPKQVKSEAEGKKEAAKTTEKEIAQGAIKKATRVSNVTDVKVNKPETSYENVRVKKVLNRAVKVSTSVQTSGAIVARKPKVEEPATGNIKSGKLYTSLSKSPSFRGTGTFQLMGAKDFATIEATKSSEKGSAAAQLQHVYANVPSPGLVQEGEAKNEPAPAATVAPVSSPAPPAKSEVTPPITAVAPPNQVLVKVETKAQIEGDDEDYDDELMRDDQSSASGAADSAISASGSLGDSDVEKLAGLLTRPKGLAEFKADLAATPPQQQSNTLAVNRLLRRLEAAIASGQHRIAAGLARDLARLKVSCSVIRQRRSALEPELFTVDMYVEDKVSHEGPIPLSVCAAMTVGELKVKVQQEFEIPANVQRWILGKQLASDDSKTLQQHSVAAAGCTVFLYLVAPPDRGESSSPATEPSAPAPTPPLVEETRMVPSKEPPRGPGWYYNFEEDRYSYCESSDEEEEPSEPEEEPQKPVVVSPPAPIPSAPTAPTPVIQLAQPEQSDSSSSEEEEEEEGPGGLAAGGLFPSAPPATLPPEKKMGTLMLGWRCPVCTLINSPTRPGCAACTTERPLEYHVPLHYQASDEEAQRLRREQELEKAAEEAGVEAAVEGADNYQALLALDNTDLVANVEVFECTVCLAACAPGDGAVLRECLHAFCRPCLAHTAQFSEDVEVRCPFRNQQYACDATLQDREVRALVPPDIYDRMQAKSVAQAENKIQNAFHCKTPDCRGWCIFEDNVNDFGCPVCGHHNCLTCQAIHDGLNCRQYQERVTQASETDAEARRTKEMLEEMVERGEALCCPTCQVVLMKKWGCDWLRCSMCKTEICWVTRGHRWGPGGKGDTTGGCKCGINGIKCHPKCNYCH